MIDEDFLTRQTAGDVELQRELLDLLLQQVIDARALLHDAADLNAPSPSDLPAVLHRIRGAAAAVGADGLARALGEAERRSHGDGMTAERSDALRAELDGAVKSLTGLIAARTYLGLAKVGESR